MSSDNKQDRLVVALQRLATERDDRAALAALRAALDDRRRIEALRFVLPYLGPNAGSRREDDALLLAGLFALHPVSGSSSLAAALRRVMWRTESESVESRFRAMLSAGRDELDTHLRHAVTLVAGHDEGIDWSDLHKAIRYWDHGDDFVRRRWARDFWASEKQD